MKVALMLQQMLKKIFSNPQPISVGTLKNINKINCICNSDYSDQKFYGAAALNRRILLDSRIASLLTPETVLAILSIHATPNHKHAKNISINRNSTGNTSLAAVLFYGFDEGLDSIRLMPNNESQYGVKKYREQKQKYNFNTKKIIANITEAAKKLDIQYYDEQFIDDYQNERKSLLKLYDEITFVIDSIKKENKSQQLLSVPAYTPDAIRNQSVLGFLAICERLQMPYTRDSSGAIIMDNNIPLQDFINRFLLSEETVLDGRIIHLFYDRAHLEACIELDLDIFFEKRAYKLKDIIKAMLDCTESGDITLVSEAAREQLDIRIKAVHAHLKQNFSEYFKAVKTEKIRLDKNHREIRNCIAFLEDRLEKEMWKNPHDLLTEIHFLKSIMDAWDRDKSKPLKEYLIQAQKQNPEGYKQTLANEGRAFFLLFLADKTEEKNLAKENRGIKNQATLELEKLLHALLREYQSLTHSRNALGELEIMIDADVYNVTQILNNNPDFRLLSFTDAELDQYGRDVSSFIQKMWLPSEEYFKKSDPDNASACLHPGEKLAINLYTENYAIVGRIQDFLRKGDVDSKDDPDSYVPFLLKTICIAAHGLARPAPGQAVPAVRKCSRREEINPKAGFFRDRLHAVSNKGAITEKAFVSTSGEGCRFSKMWISADSQSAFFPTITMDNNTYTLITENACKSDFYGKNIKSLSRYRNENEVLYPPGTSFQYLDYMELDGRHFFSVTPCEAEPGKADSYTPLFQLRHELEIIDRTLDEHIRENTHHFIRKLFDTVDNDAKLECIRRVKKKVIKVMGKIDRSGMNEDTLQKCQGKFYASIAANSHLVKNSFFPSSLGKTDAVLQSTLQRMERAMDKFSNCNSDRLVSD